MKFKSLVLGCVIAFAGMMSPLFADEEGVDYADENRGTIDAVNLEKRTIVIDDLVYNLSLALRVHEGGKLSTDFALKQRVNVEFEIDPKSAARARKVITDIWVLGGKN